MPVIRKPIQINDTRSIQPVNMPDNPMGQVLEQVAEGIIETSRQMGRMLAGEAELKGKQMVREAIFNKDKETGAPQIPADRAAEMGRIARTTYNAGIADKMVDEIDLSAKLRIDQAHIEHENDVEGFEKAVVKSLAELQSGLPPEFHGAFMTIAQRQLGDANYSIGTAQMRLDKEIRRSNVPVYVEKSIMNLNGIIANGRFDDIARSNIVFNIRRIMNEQEDILSRSEKQTYIQSIFDAVSKARIFADKDLDPRTASAAELKELQEMLAQGRNAEENEFLAEYFPDFSVINGHPDIDQGFQENWTTIFPSIDGITTIPGDFSLGKTYNQNAADRFSALLNGYISDANKREVAERKRQILTKDLQKLMDGEILLSSNKDLGPYYNARLGREIGLGQDQDGFQIPINSTMIQTGMVPDGNGKMVPMTEEQRHKLVGLVKQSKSIPPAIQEAFRAWDNDLNAEKAEKLYKFFVDFRDMGVNGVVVDMSETLGPSGHAFMETLSVLHDRGGDFDWAVGQAINYTNRMRELDSTGNIGKIYVQMLDKFIEKEGDQAWRNFWDPNDADELLNASAEDIDALIGPWLAKPKGLIDHIMRPFIDPDFGDSDNEIIDPSEMEDAAVFFRVAFMMQAQTNFTNPVEEAAKITGKAFQGRWESSKYHNRRTMRAVDKIFVQPPPSSGLKAFGKFMNKYVGAPILEGAADLFTPDMFMTEEDARIYRRDFGQDEMNMTLLDGVLDWKIKTILSAGEGTFEAKYNVDTEGNSGVYVAGRHYMLEHIQSSGKGDNPAYRIIMRDKGGLWVPITTEPYYPRDDFNRALKADRAYKDAELDASLAKPSVFDSQYNFFKYMGGGIAVSVNDATDLGGSADSDSTMLEKADADFMAGATKTVNIVGEGTEAVVDAAVDVQEAMQDAADITYEGGVGGSKDKTDANRATADDEALVVDRPIPAKRANTVLNNTTENNNAKIKVSNLWNKNHGDGRYLRDKIISSFSEKQRQSPSFHIEILILEMRDNGWEITAPEAKKMLETYKQENPDWFK